MVEPDEDLEKFEQELKKQKTSGVKKDRIVTCPGCGKKQTVMQVRLGEDVKCKSCGQTFEIKRELSQDAHLVTMAAVDLEVRQMELLQRVGKVRPRAKKKVTVAQRAPEKSFIGPGILTLILYFVFWPAGFLVNIVFLIKARSYASSAGRPGGAAFLLTLWFILLGILPLIFIVVMAVLHAMGMVDLQPYLDKLKGAAPG